MIQDVEQSLQDDGPQEDQEAQERQEEHAEQGGVSVQEEAGGSRVIHIRALMRGLDSAFLPFALLKHDPFVGIRAYIAAHKQKGYAESLTEQERTIAELVHMRNAWNSVFRELRSDQLFFLCAWSSVPGASLNVVRATGLSFMIATPGLRRWLVTRPVWRRDELVAWCEAIDPAAIPREMPGEVVLSEQNMLRLKPSLFFGESQGESEKTLYSSEYSGYGERKGSPYPLL